MPTRCSILLLALLVLGGCSSNRQVRVTVPQGSRIAWDGLGQDPNLPPARHVSVARPPSMAEIDSKKAALARLREYSREWVALRKEIDIAEDTRIAKILVICTGCQPAAGSDRTP
jgi:hypothetical protein